MKLNKSYREETTPFLDLLFNMLLGYVLMFSVAFLMIQPVLKNIEIKTKAEYLISVIWPPESADDIDTWLQDPLGNIVWFRQKEVGFMHLDRDDLGIINDMIRMPDGSSKLVRVNQELTTIRGFIPGEWVLNVHCYKKRDNTPTIVKVFVDKLNPIYRTIAIEEITMTSTWEEATAARFTMANNGEVLSINKLPKKMVEYETVSRSAEGRPE